MLSLEMVWICSCSKCWSWMQASSSLSVFKELGDLSIVQKSSSASEAHPASTLTCRSAKFGKKSMLICTGTHTCLCKSCHKSTRTVPCTSTEDYSFQKAFWKSSGPAHQLLRSMGLLRALSFFTGHAVWSLQQILSLRAITLLVFCG